MSKDTQLVPFQFHNSNIRTFTKDGKPWFVANDVARALGYKSPKDAIRDHCRGGVDSPPPSGGTQSQKVIPESDVYRLAFRSKLAAAEEFVTWIAEEVLPSIRKTGGFGTAKPETRVQRATRELAEAREAENASAIIATIAPKDNYGTLAPNGLPKLSVRAAAFYADRRGTLVQAAELNRQLRELDEKFALMNHPELALGYE